jgi:hypothetical protein
MISVILPWQNSAILPLKSGELGPIERPNITAVLSPLPPALCPLPSALCLLFLLPSTFCLLPFATPSVSIANRDNYRFNYSFNYLFNSLSLIF